MYLPFKNLDGCVLCLKVSTVLCVCCRQDTGRLWKSICQCGSTSSWVKAHIPLIFRVSRLREANRNPSLLKTGVCLLVPNPGRLQKWADGVSTYSYTIWTTVWKTYRTRVDFISESHTWLYSEPHSHIPRHAGHHTLLFPGAGSTADAGKTQRFETPVVLLR